MKPDPTKNEFIHAPLSLFPAKFPLEGLKFVTKAQEEISWLVSNLAVKPQIIHETLSDLTKNDLFLENLVDISKAYN